MYTYNNIYICIYICLDEKGFTERVIRFLTAAYLGIGCEVKVDNGYSDSFEVTTGLRQGCILSPLLFSLYINSCGHMWLC